MNNPLNSSMSGKTLFVNLSTGQTRIEDLSPLFDDYMGMYATKLLYDRLLDGTTPYDPNNMVILSCGALLGTLAPGGCKMSMSTLSPVTGGWGTGSSDSHVGIAMKAAGIDNLVIEGRAYSPCYLYLTENGIEIRDAKHLWGKTTWQTLDALRDELNDPKLHVLSIGPAGEHLSRNACVIQDKNRAFGRCGTGAVLGSKNVKAIVCRGTGAIRVADPERFFKKVNQLREVMLQSPTFKTMGQYGTLSCFVRKQEICGVPYKNFQDCKIPDEYADQMNPTKLIDKYQISRQGFPGCVLCCGREVTITEGKYKGVTANMSQWELMGAILGKCMVHNPEFMIVANMRCNQMGIDVDVVGGAVAWAMECFERGILTTNDTGGLEIHWGDEDMILKLIDMMSYRQGFGDFLADGSARAAQKLGRGSDYYAIHVKKQDLYELTRSSNAWCLGTVTSTRGGGHTTGTPGYEQNAKGIDNEACLRLFNQTAEQVQDPESYEGKAELVHYMEALHRTCNSLGVCNFNSAHWNVAFADIKDYAELTSAAIGHEVTEKMLFDAAMRQLNLEKALNLRFTGFERKDDYPPAREMNEPMPSGSRKGWRLDKEKFDAMLDRYYQLHGWDIENGYPTRKTLEAYGLNTVADDLERIGKLGKDIKYS